MFNINIFITRLVSFIYTINFRILDGMLNSFLNTIIHKYFKIHFSITTRHGKVTKRSCYMARNLIQANLDMMDHCTTDFCL